MAIADGITSTEKTRWSVRLEAGERYLLRFGLVVILFWIGAMKFTSYEANGIKPLVANSPLMSWLLAILGTQGISNLIGVVEIATAFLLVAHLVSPRASLVGSAMAAVTFLTTLTFLLSTPGWEPSLGGFPGISAMPGQFLLKDIVLLGAALYTARESLNTLWKK